MEHPPQLKIAQSELAPRVADYFDTLLVQRDDILERYGLTPETAGQFCDLQSTDEDREVMHALYENMIYVLEHKQIPHGEKFLYTFVVPDAPNPYADALQKAGLPADHHLCLEKKEMTLDMPEIIAFQTKHYRSQGMEAWADDIEQHIDQLYDQLSTPEEQQRIVLRIKAGYIPVVMPSPTVQRDHWEDAFQGLKPIQYKAGIKQDIHSSYFKKDGFRPKMTDPTLNPLHSFFKGVPDRIYLMWTKPLAECDAEIDPVWQTTNLTVKKQKEQLETLHEHHPALCDRRDMNPLEYVALQSLETETIRHHVDDCGMRIEDITPLDLNGFTRFIACALLSEGFLAVARFRSGDAQLRFGWDGFSKDELGGFRPVARS